MRTFKLILFFILGVNGFGPSNSVVSECPADSNDNKSLDNQYEVYDVSGDLAFSIDELKVRKNHNLKKTLGFGSFNDFDGQYSALLVKNDCGDIDKSSSLILMDSDLLKWMKHSKSSSPDDTYYA